VLLVDAKLEIFDLPLVIRKRQRPNSPKTAKITTINSVYSDCSGAIKPTILLSKYASPAAAKAPPQKLGTKSDFFIKYPINKQLIEKNTPLVR
jgi:hypothetical protein